MGCSNSTNEKPQGAAPPTRGGEYKDASAPPQAPQREQWQPGQDFPSSLTFTQVQKPDRNMKGITLVDCLLDNARDNSLSDCTLKRCVINNCHLKNCILEDGCSVTRCVIKGGSITETTLTSGTEVSDGCVIDRSIVTDRCNIQGCKIGQTITTTGSTYFNCTGNPQPPPQPTECVDCDWTS